MWKRLGQHLSLKEMAVATGLVLLAGGVIYGIYCGGAALWRRHLLEKSIPAVLAGARAQRETLVSLIETYKSRFGYYPPLLTAAGPDRGVLNPLCYELLGARFDPKNAQFYIPVTKDGLSRDEVEKYFNMRSFSNSLVFPSLPLNLLANRSLSVAPLTPGSDLFGVGLAYTDFTPEPFWYDYAFSAWRYLTNPARHNPGRFDLWIEIKVAGKQFSIGNWPEAN